MNTIRYYIPYYIPYYIYTHYTDYTILYFFLCSNIHPGFGASSSTWTKAFGLLKARGKRAKGWVDYDGMEKWWLKHREIPKTRWSPRTRMLTRMLMVQMSKHMVMQSRTIPVCNSIFEQSCACFPCYQSAVWSGKCRVWSVKCGVGSVECVKCRMRSVKWRVWSMECKV